MSNTMSLDRHVQQSLVGLEQWNNKWRYTAQYSSTKYGAKSSVPADSSDSTLYTKLIIFLNVDEFFSSEMAT